MENTIEKFLSHGENLYLIPPYIKEDVKKRVLNAWKGENLFEHVFIFSSGTSGSENIKTYAISKEALLENAKSVNRFLKAKDSDSWLCPLPMFHVGGLSIYVRAFLSGSKVISYKEKWNVVSFMNHLKSTEVSFISLVPTQLYDLIEKESRCPSYVKGVFIGGDFLSSELEKRAVNLNWPIIKTYGMTETCSQVASDYSKNILDGFIKVLDIHNIYKENENFYIKSKSLVTSEILFKESDIKVKKISKEKSFKLTDWLDLKTIENTQYIRPLGRIGDELKISGRLINISEIKDYFEKICMDLKIWSHVSFFVVNDERLGRKIRINIEQKNSKYSSQIEDQLLKSFPFLKGSLELIIVNEIKKTSLGKNIKVN